jgi:site-specific DNA-methyltransferase (adenine-specific)
MDEASVDSVVTDPPYGLGFMGKKWDSAFTPGDSAMRRTKEADAVNAGASRQGGRQRQCADYQKRQARDMRAFQEFCEEWFLECLRVLKPGGHAIVFGGTRTYHRMAVAAEDAGFEVRDQIQWLFGSGFPKSHNIGEGWGTALKPANEPILLARKPLRSTVAKNVQNNGTGALNIDGCRIEKNDNLTGTERNDGWGMQRAGSCEYKQPEGRWPANVIHDGGAEVLGAFPKAKGQQGKVGPEHGNRDSVNCYGDYGPRPDTPPRIDTDESAARFFYCVKASREDRNEGLDEGFQEKPLNWSSGDSNPGSFQAEGTHRAARNAHPTVKPTELMRYLCRLVTPSGGTVLDPFAGSGSTGRGAVLEGFKFIGIEQEAEYVDIARARIKAAARQPDMFARMV